MVVQAKQLSEAALQRLGQFNRRTLDGLASCIYFHYAYAHERTGTLAAIRRFVCRCLFAQSSESHP